MLTIQPNFTRNTAFRGEKAFVDQETYEAKKKYYKDKQREFNEILDDENIEDIGLRQLRIVASLFFS